MTRTTKEDLVVRIAQRLGVSPPRMSTGSTEPREIFDLCSNVLGLASPAGLTKPEIARHIVESAGLAWGADCESRGGTVTLAGLIRVDEAVELFTG
jgi:hypothetical protein